MFDIWRFSSLCFFHQRVSSNILSGSCPVCLSERKRNGCLCVIGTSVGGRGNEVHSFLGDQTLHCQGLICCISS